MLAGGQSLVPMLALRLTRFEHLVDVNRVGELAGFARGERDVGGAAPRTRQRVMERDPAIAAAVRCSRWPPRSSGTSRSAIGAQSADRSRTPTPHRSTRPSLSRSAPSSSSRAVRGAPARRGRRLLRGHVDDRGANPTSCSSRRAFPCWPPRCGFAIEEVARRHGDFALGGRRVRGHRRTQAGIALFGVGLHPDPARAPPRTRLSRAAAPAEVGRGGRARALDPPADVHASSRDRAADRARISSNARLPAPRRICVLPVEMTVNGERRRGVVEPRQTLADFLREECALTGTHLGCEHGVCGACTVLLDGEAVRSCLLFAVQAERRRGDDRRRARRSPTARCRPCRRRSAPSTGCSAGSARPGSSCRSRRCSTRTRTRRTTEIRDALSGNLCRCTGYQGIIRAVQRAADGAR